jgi:hypothetical protein
MRYVNCNNLVAGMKKELKELKGEV